MRAFSDHETLLVWESGLEQHPIDRALTVLGAALPGEKDRNGLAAMSIGQRDGHLLDLREANFGAGASGVAECPGCGELLEWTLDLDEVRATGEDRSGETVGMTVDGYELSYRLPDSTDLAAVVAGGDVAGGQDTLLRRCVLEARRNGERVDPASLPEVVVLGLAAEMEARDPRAETLLDFACPACGSRWQALFDVPAFLWAEIQARARRLLEEIVDLARAYGWSEADILAMSPARRRLYLEAT